jgi:membrane-bound lytic murein transglycosylase A
LFIDLLMMAFLLAGCAPTPTPVPPPPIPPDFALKRLSVSDYPHFSDRGDRAPLIRSIEMSLAYLKRLPDNRQIHFGADAYTVAHLMRTLKVFSRIIQGKPTPQQLNQAIQDRFIVYQSVGRAHTKDVLFTGYYEPLLKARRSPTAEFTTPVHAKPRDMLEIDLTPFAADLKGRTIVGRYTGKTVVPYPTRKEIRETADFNTKAPPIAWLRDEIDLFILQIQGSGRVELEDGSQVHVLYDGSNGRPYRSIGRLLIDEGHISREKMSMQAIRTYLQQNRDIADNIMNHNPRYIFFKSAQDGPLGALGQPLTAMRSLALDRNVLPSSALAFIATPLPQVSDRGKIIDWKPYRGFALAQDAGSAIKGPGRIDLYMGRGLQAEVGAGHLKHAGALFFLVLKPSDRG